MLAFLGLYSLYPCIQIACSQEVARPAMDGVTLLMGVYSPFHDEMKGIYGNVFTISGQYCWNMSKSLDLLTSIGFTKDTGSPYYDVLTFTSGSSSTVQIIPVEVSVRHRMTFMRSPSGERSRGFFMGAGINYIRASEEIPDILDAKGGDFGMHIFAGPQMFIKKNLAFEVDIRLLMNDVDMKYLDRRYDLTLSGLVIKAALSWYY